MPHDKSGQPLNVGDEVTLRCKVLAVNEGETQCNLLVEASERPDGESYIPQISGNSRFCEKLLPPAAPAPLKPLDVEIHPYLYIEGFNSSVPELVTLSQDKFWWDPKLASHVKRFASVEEYNPAARRIMGAENKWKIFTGIELEPVNDLLAALAQIEVQREAFTGAMTEADLLTELAKRRAPSPIPDEIVCMAGLPEMQPAAEPAIAKAAPKPKPKK